MGKHVCKDSGIEFDTKDGWISIKDKFPDKDGRYLVCVPYSPPWIGVSSLRSGKFDDCTASHWMHLPLPPQEWSEDALCMANGDVNDC